MNKSFNFISRFLAAPKLEQALLGASGLTKTITVAHCSVLCKHILLSALVLVTLSVRAQRFDWVKTYTGFDRRDRFDNWISSSVTDSEGNLYILGQCAPDALLDGEPLLPYRIPNRSGILIAKFAPDGSVVWRKSITTPGSNVGHSIKLIGDTSIVCMAGVMLEETFYWLDSVYSDAGSLMATDSISGNFVSAFITLNLDGELQEQHFLQVVYFDSDGNRITLGRQTGRVHDSSWVTPAALTACTFDIDGNGNIFVVRQTTDKKIVKVPDDTGGLEDTILSIEDGTLSGIQIWVDGHARFNIFPPNRPKRWNVMMLKFSPHFHDLLAHRYLFQDETGDNDLESIYSMVMDPNHNMHLIATEVRPGSMSDSATATIPNLPVAYCRRNVINSLVVKCDSLLNPLFVKQVAMESCYDDFNIGKLEFYSMARGDDGQDLFISGYVTIPVEVCNNPAAFVDNDTVDIVDKLFFIRIDAETGRLKSYGTARSNGLATGICLPFINWQHQMCVKHNRVFVPCNYAGDFLFGADSACHAIDRVWNNAICIWDTSGNAIGFIDMPTNVSVSNNNQSCYLIALHDSILYISGQLQASSVQLGDTTIYSEAKHRTKAYVAKYVDTAFMTPYVSTAGAPGDVHVTLTDQAGAFVAYPNPFRQRINIRVEHTSLKTENGVATAILTDLTGRRETVRLDPAGPGRAEKSELLQEFTLADLHSDFLLLN